MGYVVTRKLSTRGRTTTRIKARMTTTTTTKTGAAEAAGVASIKTEVAFSVTIVNLLAAHPIQISTIIRTIPITTSAKTTSVEITEADHPTSSAQCLIKATKATKDMEDTKATRATEVTKTTGRVTQVTGKATRATRATVATEVTEDTEVTKTTGRECRTPTSLLCSRQLLKVLVAHPSSRLARMCLPKVAIQALEDLHPSEEQRWSCAD